MGKEELQQLYENYQVYNERAERNKLIIGFYIYHGTTTDELQKIELGQIKLQEGKVYISGTKQTHRGYEPNIRRKKIKNSKVKIES